VQLEHRRAGSGEPLVLIHGIGSCWQVWEPVLDALESHHDVLAIDLPGYGRSPPVDGEPTVPALVDAAGRAMDDAGFDTAYLVGNSMGGWIAAELAARRRARTVVAFSPAGLWTPREWSYSEAILRALNALVPLIVPRAELLARSALGRWLMFFYACARPARIEPANAVRQAEAFAASPSYLPTLDWIADGPRMPQGLDRIDCPFRVAWGTHDLLLPFRQARRWERLVRSAELVRLEDLGHAPMSDDPELTASTILGLTSSAGRSAVAA
jgi:pimeloyl-ACP methyl ester carboxylesterase